MATILVVDDEPAARELLAEVVRFRGHRPLEAADGVEALERVRAERPELVISDILMPTMDGYEFVRRVRDDPALADTKVVFYTASYHEREAQQLAHKSGVARVLVKPCEPEALLEAIDQVLAGRTPLPTPEQPERLDVDHLQLLSNKLWQHAEALKVANHQLAALNALNVRLASERDPYALLEQVCSAARKLLGARYAVLMARDKWGTRDARLTVSGLDIDPSCLPRPALEAGPLGEVMQSRRPWRAQAPEADGVVALGLPAGYPPAQSVLAVPLASLTQAYGWICLVDKLGRDSFTSEEAQLLAVLGAQVGRIYENGSLYQALAHRTRRLTEEMEQKERVAAGLRQSEQRFRQLAENIQDAFFIASADLAVLHYVSPAHELIWGTTAPPPASCAEWLLQHAHAEDRERARAALLEHDRGPGEIRVAYRLVTSGPTSRWIQVRIFPVKETNGDGPRVVGTVKDISEQHRAETRIRQLNRTYAFLSGINSLIVRSTRREALFAEACRLAVEVGGFAFAWIGWREGDSPRIETAAVEARDPASLAAVGMPDSLDLDADTMAGRAMRSLGPQVCNDLQKAEPPVAMREVLLRHGYRAMAALPLVLEGRAVGCLLLVTEEAEFFTGEEMRLLNELAGDISFALDHITKTEQLHYAAYFDALTGLANRSLFLDRLAQRLHSARRSECRAAIVVMAPERLGHVNDTFGRPAGDAVLTQFAQRLREAVGDESDIARTGGDELTVIVDDVTDPSGLLPLVARWKEACSGRPFAFGAAALRLPVISGIALFPDDGDDAMTVLKNAEAALQRAKATGDEHLFYTQRMSNTVTQRLLLEHALREAIELEQFQLHYQPKVNLETRRVTGLEALLRWQSPDRGLVSPGEIIPLMEETGLIVAVGAWVLRQANRDRRRWLAKGLEVPRVAVNVSTVQLRRRDFVDTVEDALELAGGAPSIDLEVTESLIMDDAASNIRKLESLRSMGVRILLDDFGTGYSSLGYLAKLPVEFLKIDRSFIERMLNDPGAMTLVSTMISLAHSLKLGVVAEGVETEEQAKILRLLRCDEIQGYLVGRPVPADEVSAILAAAAQPRA